MSDDLIERLNDAMAYMWKADWPRFVRKESAGLLSKDNIRSLLDSLASKDAALAEIRAENERLKKERDNYRFSPQGDNHHNALKCPYCNPGLVDFEARTATAELDNEQLRKFLKPFAAALEVLGRSRYELDDRENIRGRGPDLAITMGHLRAASRALSQEDTK